ncbi:MAG TPA: mycothiol synthase [Ilumatobacter sp.]|nr:mycothiol synthase [Ilumatobacter sp.]
MYVVDVAVFPAEADVNILTSFMHDVAAVDGERPLSDHLWLDLQRGGSPGFIAVRVADGIGTVAYGQISAANHESSLEIVVHPRAAAGPPGVARLARDTAETAIDAFQRAGGGELVAWVDVNPIGQALADVCTERGLVLRRQLHEMHAALPLDQHAIVTTRDFVVGDDDAAWVRVNNSAFAEHGEQGGWTVATLALRQAEPWFDPTGFRVHEIDGRMAAFCWTKIHGLDLPADQRHGEIYVIAVHPDFHGRGLGKQLTLAGLDSIAARGISAATLYVDDDNAPALSLYRSLGFTVHRTRRAYGGTVTSLIGSTHDQP